MKPHDYDAADRLRAALRAFMEFHQLTTGGWSRKAGISEGALRNFFAGRSNTPAYGTLDALARAADTTVAEITGEGVAVGHVRPGPEGMVDLRLLVTRDEAKRIFEMLGGETARAFKRGASMQEMIDGLKTPRRGK